MLVKNCQSVLDNTKIMKSFLFLICAHSTFVSSKSVKISQIQFGMCPSSQDQNSTFDSLDVQPYPIPLRAGFALNISAQFTLNQVIPKGSTIQVNLYREGPITIQLPCYKFGVFQFGSW